MHRKTSKKNLFFEVLLWWHAWSHNCLQDFIILNTRYLWTRRIFSLFTKDFRGRHALDNKEAPTYLLFDHLTKCPNKLLGLSFPQWKTARCLSFFDELTRLGLSHWLHCNALDHGWLKTPAPPVGRALPEDPGQAASRESWLSVGLLLDYQGVSGVKSSKLDHCSKKKCVWGNHHNPQCLAMSERRILPITNSGHEEFNFFLVFCISMTDSWSLYIANA